MSRTRLTCCCVVAALLPLPAASKADEAPKRPRPAARRGALLSPPDAERAANDAVELASTDPDGAMSRARDALVSTADFEPTAFVRAGRKGEVVEDDFLSARAAYRKHRARLHAAVGRIHARRGEDGVAVRYLRRAWMLAPERDTAVDLAAALARLGQTPEAGDVLRSTVAAGASGADIVAVLERIVDTAGWPSAQVELDRARTLALSGGRVEFRDGPLPLPKQTRLSTSPVFRMDDSAVNVIYAADASCRTCSGDVEALRRLVPSGVRILVLPEGKDTDHSLRQVLGLYKVNWPVLIGSGLGETLHLAPPAVAVVGREGWGSAVLSGPPRAEIARVAEIMSMNDVRETRPRPGWNRRPVQRIASMPLPGLRPEGLAPGDEEPAPPEFEAAVTAYRERRPAQALELLDGVARRTDGWLLPAEARLNRALCLRALGRREESRKLLLRTGDSRFQDVVDRELEVSGSSPRPGR
jgi:hypothetical protein